MPETVPTLRAAAAASPERPGPAFALCTALLRAADAEAQAMLGDLLTRFPEHAEGWEEIGLVLEQAGKRGAALLCFSRAAAAEPSLGRALRCGQLLRELGRPADAVTAFRQACALDPGSARACFLLGVASQDAWNHAGAGDAYRAALALDPRLAEAQVNLGTVLQEGGDLVGAREAYRRAVTTRPDTFGRVAQALATSPRGELWLDLGALRRDLGG